MIILPALLQFNLRKTPLTKELEPQDGILKGRTALKRECRGQSPLPESRGSASGGVWGKTPHNALEALRKG